MKGALIANSIAIVGRGIGKDIVMATASVTRNRREEHKSRCGGCNKLQKALKAVFLKVISIKFLRGISQKGDFVGKKIRDCRLRIACLKSKRQSIKIEEGLG